MADIFLAFCHADLPAARRFAEEFEALGFSVARDPTLEKDSASSTSAPNDLGDAKAVVVLWSTSSVNSRSVCSQATKGDRNKALVPVVIEACERPEFFELTESWDLSRWGGAPDDPAWLAVLENVRALIDAEPSPKRRGAAAPPPRFMPDDAPSLAIMPFTNRSGLREDDALALGMVEDIVSAMSRSPNLRVLGSSATARFAARAFDISTVGRALGAHYLLEGNTRREGNHLRVTVQLVEPESEEVLWTERFDRPLHQLAALQGDLVTEMAGHLGVEVEYLELERALAKPDKLSAYFAVQLATAAFAQLNLNSLKTAVADARLAAKIAPNYPLARSVLGFSLAVQFTWTLSNESNKHEALQEVSEALRLAPDDPIILARCARALTYLDREHEALTHARKALDMNPNLAPALQALGAIYLRLGRNDDAIACFDREERLAPDNYAMYVSYGRRAQAHVQAGRLTDAYEAMNRSLDYYSDYPQSQVMRAGLCRLLDKHAEAGHAILHLRDLEPTTTAELHQARYLARVHRPSSAKLMAAFASAWEEAFAAPQYED